MGSVQIVFLAFFLQVCIGDPAPKPLDTVNVHFHLNEDSSESDESVNNRGIRRGYTNTMTNEGGSFEGDYPEAENRMDGMNRMFQFGFSEGQQCNPIHNGLSQSDKDAILAYHNVLRSKVANGKQSGQPPAANMKKMVWNDKLAKEAQKIASTCVYKHKDVFVGGAEAGQNIAVQATSDSVGKSELKPFWEAEVQGWYDEVTKYNFNSRNIQPFSYDPNTGHYSQVVWAESSEIGCGGVFYEEPRKNEGYTMYTAYLVCNYLEAGNMRDGSMYKVGKACSACSGGSCSNGLCA